MYKTNIQIFLLFISSLVIAMNVSATEKSQGKIGEIAISKPLKSSKHNWKPTPFILENDHFPINYKGNDPVRFVSLFKSKIVKLKRDEFETEIDYKARLAGKEALLAPINFTDQYAFTFDYVQFRYDPEAQVYNVEGDSTCQINYPVDMGTVVTCDMSMNNTKTNSYSAGNAYGAEVEITRFRGNSFGIAVPRSNSFVDLILTKSGEEGFKYNDKLHVNIEKARSLKNKKLGILFVGKVFDAQFVDVENTSTTPTITRPVDLHITHQVIPFELNKIFYYVIETGEILGEKSLTDIR